jgi:hypothetical protein
LVTVVALGTLLLLCGAAEFTARHIVAGRVTRAVPALGGDAQVHFAGSAVWGLTQKHFSDLKVTSDDATLGPLPGVRVSAEVKDVRLGHEPTVRRTHAEVTVPTQSIGEAIRTAAPSVNITSVAADTQQDTLVVSFGPGGQGQLTLRPTLSKGKITFPVQKVTLFGRAVDPARLGEVGTGLRPDADKPYPLGIKATSVTITDGGVRVVLDGGRSPLKGEWSPPSK